MSTENHTPNPSNDLDYLAPDIDRVHELSEALLPVYAQIEANASLPDATLNAKLIELMSMVRELHPADMALVLESLPPKERVIVWKTCRTRRRWRCLARSFRCRA